MNGFEDFIKRGRPFKRLKDEFPDELPPIRDPRVRLKPDAKKGIKTWSYTEDK